MESPFSEKDGVLNERQGIKARRIGAREKAGYPLP